MGLAMNPVNGHPTWGVPTKGYPEREALEYVEFQLEELDCLTGLGHVSPLALVHL